MGARLYDKRDKEEPEARRLKLGYQAERYEAQRAVLTQARTRFLSQSNFPTLLATTPADSKRQPAVCGQEVLSARRREARKAEKNTTEDAALHLLNTLDILAPWIFWTACGAAEMPQAA